MNNENYVVLYGIHTIVEVIKCGKRRIRKIFIHNENKKKLLDEINKKNLINKIEISIVDKKFLERITKSKEHQGIAAYVDNFKFKKEFFNPEKNKLIILLDKIQDPRNFGALLRTAYCTNITGVIIGKSGSCPLTSSAFKASAGLSENLDIFETSSSEAGVLMAKNFGYEIYLADFGGSNINKIIPEKASCIVIGSEGFGVGKNLKKYGKIISIPQKRNDISYNASVAGAIIMFNFATKMNLI